MKTYKILAGALRNSSDGDYILAAESGPEGQAYVPALGTDTIIRVVRLNNTGGHHAIITTTLGDLIDRMSGL